MTAIGYFTAEIGLWSELHTYSGGLGVLAGDHVKSAADAGIPLVAVTLLYHQGYARQHIDDAGIQTETFPELDMNHLLTKTNIVLDLELDGKPLFAYVWMAEILGQSGHMVPVYFMDTRHPENAIQHQDLSSRLYGGDDGVRIRQEYVLGVGGVQLFDHLEVELNGLHLNEGHCTFAMLELLNRGWSREQLAQRSLFTTHTPVPAGHDRFDWSLVEEVIGDLLPADAKELVRSAGDPEDASRCSMSHLAVSLSTTVNAVSKLNADVAMTMFDQNIQPITNGVHHITWTAPAMASFFDEHLNGWKMSPTNLEHASSTPTTNLLQARAQARQELRDYVRSTTGVELDSNRLTIGFARRFATYKRANLVFRDLKRLQAIGAGKIQFVFSGKAHPRDQGGKQLIRDIFASAEQIEDDIPVAFIENYDMKTGLMMTSGVDIWLNNPIRPMEASGTSGMKAAMNGVPNCSILDGWWPEACVHGVNGWAIGEGEDDRDDERDANNIYNVLEHEVIPLWENDQDGWAEMMKASIVASAGFSGQRMIQDYLEFYNQFS